MNADGSNQHALTNSPSREDMAPSFSPDGKQVAFQACVADYCSIWVMGLNGTGARQVTSPAIADARPAFSPDGKRVVFQRSIADGTTRLYSQALSGGTATQVATGYDFKASWGRVPTPSIDTPPTITGAARAGHALTAKAGAAGWGGSASLQWLRCGTTCAVIPGATTVGYRPTNADVGKKLVVRQTQTSAGGSVSADSARFGPVAREPGALIAKRVKRAREGLLLARVSCPATQSIVCQGKVTLTAIARGRAVKVGSTTFDVAAAKSAAVTLRVSKRARALVAKGHKPRLKALLVTRDDAGNNTIRKQAVALR
jgi:hypothetical protein